MATKYWYNATGDWYTGTWYIINGGGNLQVDTPPASGDVAIIQAGTATITAADVLTNGALANVDIRYNGPNTAVDFTNGTIDAQSTIEAFFTNVVGTATLRGTTSLAGKLIGQAGTSALSVDIETASAANRLNVTSTGAILALQSGTVALTGIAGSVVANSGLIQAGTVIGGSAQLGVITASVAIDNSASMVASAFSTITLTGGLTNEATGVISVGQSATLQSTGTLINSGSISVTQGNILFSGNESGSGTIIALNAGTVAFTGASSAVVANAGTLQAGQVSGGIAAVGTLTSTQSIDNTGLLAVFDFSTATLSAALTNEAAGRITESNGTLRFNGGLRNLGSLAQSGGTVSVLTLVTNSGTITQSSGTFSVGGGVINNGSIALNGTDTLAGGVINNSAMSYAGGALAITGGLTGTGTLTVGNDLTLSLLGSVASTGTIAFATGVGVLSIATPSAFTGTITNLSGHDLIDLAGLANATAVVNAGTVTVSNGGTVVTTFTATGLTTGSLNSTSDGNGGTILTLKQTNSPSAVINTEVNGGSGTAAHQWAPIGGSGPIVTYSFDSASNWSAAEKQSFVNGLGLWSAVAKINFSLVTSGGQVNFVRGSDGQAYTSSAYDNTTGNNSSATVSIDTSVGSFANLVTFGTADTTGFGGYGWGTVLHEIGHVLGLSHPGNYNEVADLATQQTYYTDTHQYSVMSYFGAQYSGANWTTGGTTYNTETPMLYDIAAAQQIYGANTSMLAGNDTFGFNASAAITGNSALNQVYNFASNGLPIVTLWDGGSNNTLDLSGYSTASVVNLNAGTFSSFNGLSRNLSIAINTAIDKFVGGAGNDVITVNSDADVINGGGGSNTAVFGNTRASYTVAFNGGTVTVTPVGGGNAATLTNIQTVQFSDTSIAACFLRGTRIMTERGEVAIENLVAEQDWAITASGHAARIVWIGHRMAELRRHPRPWDVMPVRIAAGAFGDGLPRRDLMVSPDHALLIDGVLIPARALINGATVVQESHDRAEWFHVELEWHDAILAEGLATESYLDTDNRHAFDNGGLPVMLHADFASYSKAALAIWAERGMAPLCSEGEAVIKARRDLMTRATALGFAVVDDDDAHLRVDGRRIDGRPMDGGLEFLIPAGARSILLCSHASAPADTDPTSSDRRPLGLAVVALEIDGVAVTTRRGAGWHPAEATWQWTDGAAELPCWGGRSIWLRLADTGMGRWIAPERERRAFA